MTAIPELRRLRLSRLVSVNGYLTATDAADVWQDDAGHLNVVGLWKDAFMPSKEDVEIQATTAGVSPLEWLRIRLSNCPTVKVEIK